jgi:uncharacterized protein YdaU (DUF1376 family)
MKGDDDSVSSYMPWFLGDYRQDTGDLSCTEHGAYLQLLGELWTAGGYLPFEPARLAARIRLPLRQWDAVWGVIGRFFDVFDGKLSQKRNLHELEKARELRTKKKTAARAGAAARWKDKDATQDATALRPHPKDDATALRSQCHPPSPSPLSPSDSGLSLLPGSLPDLLASGSDARARGPGGALVQAVFEHYRAYHPRAFLAPKADSKEYRLIQARLREGSTVEDLCKAIDGYHRSPWHCGVNDSGTKYQSLELIMRNGSNVTKGIGYADEGPRMVSAKEARGHAAGETWLAMHGHGGGDAGKR